MKKVFVIAITMILGLGLFAFAQGTVSGDWDTEFSIYPSAGAFEDFVAGLTSKLEVDYTMGGWVFAMKSTFKVAGLTGMDFEADGTLGAFTLDLDVDFDPHVLATTATSYTSLTYVEACSSSFAGLGVSWTKKTVANTYTAAFDDLKAAASLSIGGVELGTVFFLEGKDSEYAETKTGLWIAATPAYTSTTTSHPDVTQTGSLTVADTTNVGSGFKLSASGDLGGASVTGLLYLNLSEYSYNDYNAGYVPIYVKDTFKKSGVYSVVCDDCIPRFTGAEIILEDVSFACASVSTGVAFDCCGFENVKFLVEDIGLGWDVDFDLLLTFTPKTKGITIEPDITLSNACFTIDAAVHYTHTEATAFQISGIDIRGLSLEYSFDGITFVSDTSWDLANHPILGGYYYSGTIYSPTKIYVWQPDTDATEATTTYVAATDTCTIDSATPAVDMTTGEGYWELTSFACEQAKAWEKFSIDVDGDSCCGGAFDFSVDFYFGDVTYLSDLDGTYYFDANYDGTYAETAGVEYLVIYGTQDPTDVPSVTGWTSGCNCCPCDDCAMEVDEVEWDADYTAKTANRLFDWIETDIDVSIGIGSNLTLTLGVDVNLWGWEDLTVGFDLTF